MINRFKFLPPAVDQFPDYVESWTTIFYNILMENKEPTDMNRVNKIVDAFNDVVEAPPEFDIGLYKAYFMLAGSITMAKKTDTLWCYVPEQTKEKLDLMMELFLYAYSCACHAKNNYNTGFHWNGKWSKFATPPYRFSCFGTAFFACEYFGEVRVNELLTNFNFDSLMQRVLDAGFVRCYNLWTQPKKQLDEDTWTLSVKEMLEDGGEAFISDSEGNVYTGGSGVSIKDGFIPSFGNKTWEHVINDLLNYCYSDNACQSQVDMNKDGIVDAYIKDGTISPVEGQKGMMLELIFGYNFPKKIRSSAHACIIAFKLATSLIAYCEIFRRELIDKESELYEKIRVGNLDLNYKVNHGYIGGFCGKVEVVEAYHNHLGTDKNNNYINMYNYWETYLA